MAQTESKEEQMANVDRMAAARMGVEPATPSTKPDPLAATEDKDRPTAQEKAASEGAPETEADKQKKDPVIYDVEFGENDTRKLTPGQISGTFNRYRDMNYKHQQLKPVMDVANVLMERFGGDAGDVAKAMIEAAKAEESKQRGEVGSDTNPAVQDDVGNDSLKVWEDENAVKLPPGYRDIAQNMQALQQMQLHTQQMMQEVVAGSQAVGDAARASVSGANDQAEMASRQQIANNLDRAQQHLNLPDEAGPEFMMFATEMGFTPEDFVDPDLTVRIATAFRDSLQSGEYQRMKAINERRTAYTGSMGAAPTTATTSAEPTEEMDDTLDRLAAATLASRNQGLDGTV
jgi:hypothetical protein